MPAEINFSSSSAFNYTVRDHLTQAFIECFTVYLTNEVSVSLLKSDSLLTQDRNAILSNALMKEVCCLAKVK